MSTDPPPPEDDLLIFEDRAAPTDRPTATAWRILVVDDDEDVHSATRFALHKALILGRPIELHSTCSTREALEIARTVPDLAVALVDVVMDTPDAGLLLVQELRAAGLSEMRVILRTGYPGYAPEASVVRDYEIDDYRSKDELTRQRLLSVLTTSLRSYEQIRTISRSRAGLEMVVHSATKLFQRTNLELFSRGVLTQIAALFGIEPHGLVCAKSGGSGQPDHCRIVSAVGRFGDLVGRSPADIPADAVRYLLERAREQTDPVIRDGHMALHFRTDSGRELSVVLATHAAPTQPDLDLLRLFSTNIAIGFENLALVEALDRLAYVDPILEVPNLNAFEAALKERLQREGHDGQVAFTRIDSLQALLASYGPQMVRGLLREVYNRLVDGRETSLTVARIGDGSFGMLAEGDALLRDLVPAAFSTPYRIDGLEIAPSATTAILDLAEIRPDVGSILREAISALEHVRQTHRGQTVEFDATMRAVVERRTGLRRALKRTVSDGTGLAVHLQPKFDLASGQVIGAEALLRWTNDGAAVSPGEFIPIAESAGLTAELTEFVVRELDRWNRSRTNPRPLPVAVNLSMADLSTPRYTTRLLTYVSGTALSPTTLEFEVTEGIAMEQAPWAIAQVRALHDAGFRIAIDDFGTGYSSLSRFNDLAVDTIKIDRSFVRTLDVGTARHSLAATVLAMTQALDVDCVAEGIETQEQKQALIFLGCRVGQGYLLGRPTPIDEFDARFGGGTAH